MCSSFIDLPILLLISAILTVSPFLDQLEDIGNVKRLLHGTKCGNVFGILSRGFLLPNVEDLHKKYPNCEDLKLCFDLLHVWRYEDPLFRTVGPRNILCGSA